MNVFVPLLYEGYSYASHTVSELSAVGAPTRTLWVVLGLLYSLLTMAFGCGVWISAGPNRPLRVAGGLLLLSAFLGVFWPPMHQREELAAGGATLTDTLHIAWTMVWGLLTLLAMGFAAAALGRVFRLYSIATMFVLLAFGFLAGLDAPQMEKDLPTPLIGIWERINIFAYVQWLVVFSVVLLRVEALGGDKK
jgi:hypothetical protein